MDRGKDRTDRWTPVWTEVRIGLTSDMRTPGWTEVRIGEIRGLQGGQR